MLRIRLMCTSDVTPITIWLPEYQEAATADFSTLHKCRNFDKILQWAQENGQDFDLVKIR